MLQADVPRKASHDKLKYLVNALKEGNITSCGIFLPSIHLFFSYHIYFVCVHVYEMYVEGCTCVTTRVWTCVWYVCRRVYMCHNPCVKVAVQPERTSSLFPLCRSQGWTRVFKDMEASTFTCGAILPPMFLPFKAS